MYSLIEWICTVALFLVVDLIVCDITSEANDMFMTSMTIIILLNIIRIKNGDTSSVE